MTVSKPAADRQVLPNRHYRQHVEQERGQAARLLKQLTTLHDTCQRLTGRARTFRFPDPRSLLRDDPDNREQHELITRLEAAHAELTQAGRALKVLLFNLDQALNGNTS